MPEILLVTSRRSRRWMIPKGWPMLGKSLAEAAAREAFEEAGVHGTIEQEPIGSFRHRKRYLLGSVEVDIRVHLMTVEVELTDWPEREQRKRKWFSLSEALSVIDSQELQQIISEAGLDRPKDGPVS